MKVVSGLFGMFRNQTAKNFSALAIVQATNYLFPIIAMPYIIRTIGTEKFGLISLAQALFSYQVIITDFSFHFTSSAAIAQNKTDLLHLSKVVSETITVKGILCTLMFLVLQALILTVPWFRHEAMLFNLGFMMVLGQAILPAWFFQGMEKMQYLSYINFLAKSLFLVCIFVIVREEQDYVYVVAINGLGNFLSGCIGLYLIFNKFGVRFVLPSMGALRRQFRNGQNLMYSNVLTNLYTNSNILVLSFFVSGHMLGVYSIAEKIIQTIRSVIIVFFQATYPRVSQLKIHGIANIRNYFRSIFPPFVIGVLFVCSCSAVFASFILQIISGKFGSGVGVNSEMVFCLQLFCIVPFIVALAIPVSQILLLYGFRKIYLRVVFIGTLISFTTNFILSSWLFSTGTIISIIITELFITLACYYSVYKHYESIINAR